MPNHLHLNNSHELWTYPLGGKATPVIANDRVYALGYRGEGTSFEDVLVALDTASGDLLWEYTWKGAAPHSPPTATMASPTVDPYTGMVAVLTSGGYLSVFSVAGKLLWQHAMDEKFGPSSPVSLRTEAPRFDGELVIVQRISLKGEGEAQQQQPRFYGFQKRTGKLVWSDAPLNAAPATSLSTPFYDASLTHRGFWVASGCGHLVCMDTQNGRSSWRQRYTEEAVHSSVLLDETHLFVVYGQHPPEGVQKGSMLALKRTLAPHKVAPSRKAEILAEKTAWRIPLNASMASPVDGGDVLYQLNVDGELMSIEKTTGKVRWKSRFTNLHHHISPLFGDDKLYFPTKDGQILVLGPTLHGPMTLSKTTLKGQCLSSPSAFDGRIFVHTTEALYAFGRKRPSATTAPEVPPH